MIFSELREIPWEPKFKWVKTSKEAADLINLFHEDYPQYVEDTWEILEKWTPQVILSNTQLLGIHRSIFYDKHFAGKFRKVNVRIGQHHPPSLEDIQGYMDRMASHYKITDIPTLIEWYKDFETIHPFQDGNGRVGGVVVAAYSHKFNSQNGWLSPMQ
jgi:fido (protein-threonine AMPylation protein)